MSDNKRYGLGICDVLGIVFIVLKLLGVIDWSWWWVLAPIWIPVVIVLVLYGVLAICK
jgi:hypothetical protein